LEPSTHAARAKNSCDQAATTRIKSNGRDLFALGMGETGREGQGFQLRAIGEGKKATIWVERECKIKDNGG